MGLLTVVAWGSSGAILPASAAASPDPKSAARRKLVEGADLLKRGEYQTALARFQAAYDLVPSPKIQYNFGLAYMGLGRNADALEAFQTFLSEASDATTETITRARVYKDGLVQKICRLTVRADFDGASIAIDGRSYGSTPRFEEILVDPGVHWLLVERPGIAKPFNKRFDATAGRSLTIEAKLLTTEPGRTARPRAETSLAASAESGAATGSSHRDLAGIVTAPPESSPGAPPRWVRWTAFTTGGLAVLALGFGTVEWVVKEQRYRKFNQDPSCDRAFADRGGANCAASLTAGDRAKSLGYAGFAVAGALGVASTVFFLVGRGGHNGAASESALACTPSLTTAPGGACSLRF
jgi:hypothetical protein